LHTVEYLAKLRLGEDWKSDLLKRIAKGKTGNNLVTVPSAK